MRWFKTIQAVMVQNFRKWKSDYHVWIAVLLLMVFIHSYTKGLSDLCSYYHIKSSPWLFPFIYMQYYAKILFFLPLLLIFSNAPFIDNNQFYIIARSGKTKWFIGQMCYIIITSAIYFVFIILCSIMTNLDCISYNNEWGKVINTLANTSAGTSFNIELSVNKNVIQMFTPMQAMWFTFLHSWLSGIILGLVIFLFNLKLKGSGTFVASFILVFSAIASKSVTLTKYSPITWSTLNYIQLKSNDGLPSYQYVSTVYCIAILALIGCILISTRKYNIDND